MKREDLRWTEPEVYKLPVPANPILALCHALVRVRANEWRRCKRMAIRHIKGEGSYLLCDVHAAQPTVFIPHNMKGDT